MDKVLIVGSGYMASEYLKVLVALGRDVIVVGRGEEKVERLKKEFPQFEFFKGGLADFFQAHPESPAYAINTVNVQYLKEVTIQLLKQGVKNLLIEKPGDIYVEALREIEAVSSLNNANVLIAYNRRFYSSVLALQEELKLDGGVTSAHFEFTEWVHTIDPAGYNKEALKKWIISNSSHVIDTTFAIIGLPKILNSNVFGQNNLAWHPSGTIFTGSGISEDGVPFTYHSNWEGPGRWAIEISTRKRRFFLKPMERLQQQIKGSVQIADFEVDDTLDADFKPGIFLQTKAFLNQEFNKILHLEQQLIMLPFYYSIGGY